MAIAREVHRVERIVPVRFTRSRTVPPLGAYAPDPDDRGFTGQHGPIIGCTRRDTVHVNLKRDLLDHNAPLFVTAAEPAKLTVTNPVAGVALANGEHVDIVFRAGSTDGDTKLEVRAQSDTGPIVAELTVHISELMEVHCAVHRTAIYNLPGARSAANTTTRSFADIADLMLAVNRVWRPVGVAFVVDTQRDNTNLTNQVPRDGVNPSDGVLLCPVYGGGTSNDNFTLLMGTNTVASRLNLYFVRGIQAANPGGGAAPNYLGFGSAAEQGMVAADSADLDTSINLVAHELGHILNLSGRRAADPNAAHSDDDPRWSATVTSRRHDIWTRRRLMYYMIGLQAAERTGPGGRYAWDATSVGYGEGRTGRMITIKNLNQDLTDNEYTDARNQAATLP